MIPKKMKNRFELIDFIGNRRIANSIYMSAVLQIYAIINHEKYLRQVA